LKYRAAIECLQEATSLRLIQARELEGFGLTEEERRNNGLRAAGLREEAIVLSEAIQALVKLSQGGL